MRNQAFLMKQLQQVQAMMMKFQEELASKEFVGEAGGGAVKVKVNGLQDVLEVKIDPDVVDPEDVETLEDLILVAARQAIQKSKEYQQSSMQGLAGSLGLPNLF